MSLSPNEDITDYTHQEWPCWFVNDDTGARAIFESPEVVPEGWSIASATGHADEADQQQQQPTGDDGDDDDDSNADEVVKKLAEGHTQAELLEMLNAMKALDDSIEYAGNWSKPRLAGVIVSNGGPLEA